MSSESNLRGSVGELGAGDCFPGQAFTGCLGQTEVFMWYGALRRAAGGGVWLLFFGIFLLALAGFSFRGRDRALGNNHNEF